VTLTGIVCTVPAMYVFARVEHGIALMVTLEVKGIALE